MVKLANQNILICCNLKSERVKLFNYFDSREAEMIYSAKDVKGCEEILATEKIDYLIIECSNQLINSPEMFAQVIESHSKIKTLLIINQEINLEINTFENYKSIADIVIFEPLSDLEIQTKLISLDDSGSEKNIKEVTPETVIKEPANNKEIKKLSNCDEIWNAFFNDSSQAKIIVNAADLSIMHVNESLQELFSLKNDMIIGKKWDFFDIQDNKPKYDDYIIEINSNEFTQFKIIHKNNNLSKTYNAEFHLSLIDGNMVYIGQLTYQKSSDVSQKFNEFFQTIYNIDVNILNFQKQLDAIRRYLQFDFLVFSKSSKLSKDALSCVGDKNSANKVLSKSMQKLMPYIDNCNNIKYTLNPSKPHDLNDVLEMNELQSICVYSIDYKDKVYGFFIAGGQIKIENWDTISVVFQMLVCECKFNLYHKEIKDQREVDGQKDKLTGLPNRNSMKLKLQDIATKGVEPGKYISYMIIDFENINYLNKNLGIDLTDEIILSLAKLIEQSVKKEGSVYRMTADEFVIIYNPNIAKKHAENCVAHLMENLNKPILLSNGDSMTINYNIGISIYPDDGQTVSSMMKNTGLAIHDAKLLGKNNYIVFKYAETGKALKQRKEMEENLKLAIKNDHIKVFFQPKINAVTEDIIGFEALVRWIDPDKGMINPGLFIPLAEETGLINEIGAHVAKRSCEKLVEWQRRYGLSLQCSINLSVIQLIDENLPKELGKIIDASGVHPQFIDFEITETISLDVVPNLVKSLNEIVALGCTLSIDDFGTGHSSLDYVKKIPAKYIKIDQSFVKNIGLNPEDEAILDATINIAKRLDRMIVAEGVETEEQREYLVERNVEYFQGFLFSRPMSEPDIEILLEQRVKLMGSL